MRPRALPRGFYPRPTCHLPLPKRPRGNGSGAGADAGLGKMSCAFVSLVSCRVLELELIQSHKAQNPVLRGEVGCACVAREVSVEREGMGERRVVCWDGIGLYL